MLWLYYSWEPLGFFCRLAEADRSLALKLLAIWERHQIYGTAVLDWEWVLGIRS